MATPIADYRHTGIEVVIVGAGFGGLTAAIECHLKGHRVVVLDKTPKWEQLGDIISISPNAGQILSRWDKALVADRLDKLCMHQKFFRIHTHTGEFVLDQPVWPPNAEKPMFNGHRADIHRVIREYAASLGIPIILGQRAQAYHEDTVTRKAWVSTDTGRVFKGDVVIAADGVRSRGRQLVLGYDDKPKSSGYAVYRAWFGAEESGFYDDPLTREFVINGDTHTGWLGEDVHFLVATCKGGKEVSWVCTHKDDANIDESWSFPGKLDEVLAIFKNWDPRCKAIISKAPACVDWKLVYREPLPTWVTKNGLTCLLGDAAHPFLPTSIQGCSQAMEDGVAVATALALSHTDASISAPNKVPAALKAYERLRYSRVKAAQKQGEIVRDLWHKADWQKVRQNPLLIRLPRPDWLLLHDSEKFVRRLWSRVIQEQLGEDAILHHSLAAGINSDEFEVQKREQQEEHLPPTPARTPDQEVERRLE